MSRNKLFRTRGREVYVWLLSALCIAAFFLALLLPLGALGLSEEENMLMHAQRNGEVIRLHILAKDNSPMAQAQKLAVRDAVLDAYGAELAAAGAKDADAAYMLLQTKRKEILAVACEAAARNGCTDPIRAEVGLLDMPQKRYGNVCLPAGEYRGLRLIIGEGKGDNWWCVLFPRLCIALGGEAVQTQKPDWEWKSLRILSLWPVFMPATENAE